MQASHFRVVQQNFHSHASACWVDKCLSCSFPSLCIQTCSEYGVGKTYQAQTPAFGRLLLLACHLKQADDEKNSVLTFFPRGQGHDLPSVSG